MPNENVDDGRLDVKVSSPGTPGTGTTPEMHHSPKAKCVFSHEGEDHVRHLVITHMARRSGHLSSTLSNYAA
jgi:hypothetical protein